jgi:hypothetical protein
MKSVGFRPTTHGVGSEDGVFASLSSNGTGTPAAESLPTMSISIVPITEDHIEGFWAAVDSIARERRYIARFEAPPIESTRVYVRQHIRDQRPHVVALDGLAVVGYWGLGINGTANRVKAPTCHFRALPYA